MDALKLFDWKNSLDAIDELEKLLQCNVCGKIAEDPQCLGRCDHHYCRCCAKELENGTCPFCKVPAPPCEMQPDRIISDLVESCRDLRTLISGEGDIRTDDAGVLDGRCTPERGKKPTISLREISGGITMTNNNNSSNTNNNQASNRNKQGAVKSKGWEAEGESKAKKKAKITQRTPANKTSNQHQASTSLLTSRPEKKPKVSTPVAEAKKIPKVADLSVLGMSPKTVAINRRNTKGETLLHVACIKGDKEKVKQLLSEGANPNTKDNAGWTPLHEVCSHGFEDIAGLLLRHGAVVDPMAGSNETPLHDAVTQGQVALVKLLRTWGADDTVRNLHGHTPRYLATKCLGAAQLNAALDTPMDPSLPRPSLPLMEKMVLLGAGLSRQQTKKLETLARMLRAKLMTEYSPEVTHVVADCTPERLASTRTAKYMMGVVAGKWIVTHAWMDECLKIEAAVSPADYEVLGCGPAPDTSPGAPALGRRNSEKMRPGLFSGCHMFLWGTFPGSNGKKEVEGLVRAGGGSVLAREPNAEAILDEERKVPFHASPDGPLGNCSHYIIYSDGPSEPQLKYDMNHFKSLPLSWLHSCVDSFSLPPPVK
ncbi:BRCA1-associated RING domain protein 1-like [Portunus trituberculatus]|uniref:BRCA1-associated RING domain protein 1-like n=1 Tax=Portunus trituberculatus TaxID=210409 RepID=UPI001E1D0D59|nr:BRCA1-associated RING domain protein 1-like [Portunus trituberculatus]